MVKPQPSLNSPSTNITRRSSPQHLSIMKVLFVVSCLLAVAAADYLGHHHLGHHIPVIGHNGVPLEPAAVVHARQSHLAIVANAKAHQGHGYAGAYDGGLYGAYAGAGAYGHGAYGHGVYGHGAHHIPVIGHNGVPLDTPEVSAAKAAHFAAYSHIASAHHGGHYGHYRKRRGAYGYAHVPAIGHGGVPLDTPEVAAAKSAHFAAHAQASHGYAHGGAAAGYAGLGHYAGGHGYGHHFPALAHDGQVLETPEVVALKHAHFAAHAEANARIGAHGGHGVAGHGGVYGAGYAGSYDDGSYHGGHAGHGVYAGHAGAYHVPVIGHHGVPHDTPEVAAAKQHHFAALAEATARAGHGYGHHDHGHGHY